jgi:hypothetical protein
MMNRPANVKRKRGKKDLKKTSLMQMKSFSVHGRIEQGLKKTNKTQRKKKKVKIILMAKMLKLMYKSHLSRV